MKKANIKAIILFTVFIDILGLGVVIPVLPFYVQSFGARDIVVTLLFTVYALLSFFSAPVLGSLSDRWGRRPKLIISIISSAIGWLVFASAGSILILFIGRIIDGLAAGNITTAQSLLADISTDEKERTTNMGLVGAMFGIGFIIGPVIGGYMTTWGHTAPFWFVAVLASINAVLAYFILPETHTTRKKDHIINLNPFTPIIDGLRTAHMRLIFTVWFIFGVAISLQQSVFSLYSKKIFSFNEKQIGILFGIVGILILINQVVFMKKIWLTYFSQKRLLYVMLAMFGMGMICMSWGVLVIFYVGVVLATFGQGTLRGVFNGLIAGLNPEKRGEYLGIATALMSLSMGVGPLIATVVYQYNPGYTFVLSGIMAVVALVLSRKVSFTS